MALGRLETCVKTRLCQTQASQAVATYTAYGHQCQDRIGSSSSAGQPGGGESLARWVRADRRAELMWAVHTWSHTPVTDPASVSPGLDLGVVTIIERETVITVVSVTASVTDWPDTWHTICKYHQGDMAHCCFILLLKYQVILKYHKWRSEWWVIILPPAAASQLWCVTSDGCNIANDNIVSSVRSLWLSENMTLDRLGAKNFSSCLLLGFSCLF